MMEWMRTWLLSGLTAGVICALADALMPPGPVKRVGQLVSGMVLACVILSPLITLDFDAGERWLMDYFVELETWSEELKQEVTAGMKPVIEEECAAYILDKAAEVGLTCTVGITCREEAGIYVPHQAAVSGLNGEMERIQVAQWLEQDLGIPPERQRFDHGEEMP